MSNTRKLPPPPIPLTPMEEAAMCLNRLIGGPLWNEVPERDRGQLRRMVEVVLLAYARAGGELP